MQALLPFTLTLVATVTLLDDPARGAPVADAGGPYVVVDAVDDLENVAVDGSGSTGATSYEWDCLYVQGGSFDVDVTGPQATCVGLDDGTTPVALRVRDGAVPPAEDIDVTTITVIVPSPNDGDNDACEGCYQLFPPTDERATPPWAASRDANGLYVWRDREKTELEFFPQIKEISCIGGAAYGHGPSDPEPWFPNRAFGTDTGCPGEGSSLAFRELRKDEDDDGEVGYNVMSWKTGLDRYDGVQPGNMMCHDQHPTDPPGICQKANTGCTDAGDCPAGDRCVELVGCAECGQPGATQWDMIHMPWGKGYRHVLHKSFDWRNNTRCHDAAHPDIIQAAGDVQISGWSVWQNGRIKNSWSHLTNYKGFRGNAAGDFQGFVFHAVEWGQDADFSDDMNPVGPYTGMCDEANNPLNPICYVPQFRSCTTNADCAGIHVEQCDSVWTGGGAGSIRPCKQPVTAWLVGVRIIGSTGDPVLDRNELNFNFGDGQPNPDGSGCNVAALTLIDIQSSICSDDTSVVCSEDSDCGPGATCLRQYKQLNDMQNEDPIYYDDIESAISGEQAAGRPIPPFLHLACAGWATPPHHCIQSVGPDEVVYLDQDEDGAPDDVDNCLALANPSQLDSDLDGYGNRCDADYDNDGVAGIADLDLFPDFGTVPPSDPIFDHDADNVVGVPDYSIMVYLLFAPPGPSALACAGTIPCPAP